MNLKVQGYYLPAISRDLDDADSGTKLQRAGAKSIGGQEGVKSVQSTGKKQNTDSMRITSKTQDPLSAVEK